MAKEQEEEVATLIEGDHKDIGGYPAVQVNIAATDDEVTYYTAISPRMRIWITRMREKDREEGYKETRDTICRHITELFDRVFYQRDDIPIKTGSA